MKLATPVKQKTAWIEYKFKQIIEVSHIHASSFLFSAA